MGKITKVICEICQNSVDGFNDLDYHLEDFHPEVDKKEYYEKYKYNIEVKICKTCGKEKFKFLFHADKHLKDGYKNHCIDCTSRKKYPDKWVKREEERNLAKEGKKKCSTCSEIYLYENFTKDKYNKDGYTSNCNHCRSKSSDNYIKNNAMTIKIKEKACTKCKEIKKTKEFHKNSKTKDGLDYHCKDCKKKYREENKEILNLKNKERYYNKSPEERFLEGRKQREKNKEIVYIEGKGFIKRNKESIRKTNNEYNKKRRSDPEYLFFDRNRSRIYNFLHDKNKSESTKNLIGYSYQEFKDFMINTKNRIQEEYTFDDYHKGILTLDHIVPMEVFPHTEEGVKEAYQLKNLRLVTMHKNCSKQDKIDIKLFEKFEVDTLYYKQVYSDFT